MTEKPILCLDFDGVLHSYTTGWSGPSVIPDPIVPGAVEFIIAASRHFQIAVFSSRSSSAAGRMAMRRWLHEQFELHFDGAIPRRALQAVTSVQWPMWKPAAFITIDDRAMQFDGTWPDVKQLVGFKPWNKR